MKIHHIGIIVTNIQKNIELYSNIGYFQQSEIVYDHIQNNKIVFIQNIYSSQTIELIEPINENSTVYNFKKGYHHICYDVSNQKNFLSEFNKLKIGKIFTSPINAPAINNRLIVFALLKNNTFIEFLL